MKLGSLFDGSGGFPLAGSLCGITPVWASEVEPYPIAVTRSRFPQMKHIGDVSKINGAKIEPVDVITFGSPCQDLSVAGLRKGLKHEDNGDGETTRSGLFMEAVRIIREMRKETNGVYPRIALWENVPGAFSSNKGEDFRIVLQELIRIVEPDAEMPAPDKNGWPYADCYVGDGWSIAYRTFDAQFWGVPQRRRRIYLVADFAGERAGKILFERESLRGYFAAGRTPWKGTEADAQDGTRADDCAGECIAAGFKSGQGDKSRSIGWEEERSPTLASEAGCNSVQSVCLKEVLPFDTTQVTSPQNGCNPKFGDPCHPLEAQGHPPTVICKCYDARGNGECDTAYTNVVCYPEVANTLAARYDGSPQPDRGNGMNVVRYPINDKATRYMGGGESRNHDGSGNGLGVGNDGDPSPTLTAGDRHAVCYSATYQKRTGPLMANSHQGSYSGQDAYMDMLVVGEVCDGIDCRIIDDRPIVFDKEVYNSGVHATGGHYIAEGGPSPTLRTSCPPGVCVRYIVRRLTPTECARLQGFPDDWGHISERNDMSDDEYRFWLDVRNTHASICGKQVKEYTKDQILRWYNKLHTDSAEYKMWGNGIALPTALYVMQGIADELRGGVD